DRVLKIEIAADGLIVRPGNISHITDLGYLCYRNARRKAIAAIRTAFISEINSSLLANSDRRIHQFAGGGAKWICEHSPSDTIVPGHSETLLAPAALVGHISSSIRRHLHVSVNAPALCRVVDGNAGA